MEVTVADEHWMARAIALADTARRRTSPNPWVGCVVVPIGAGQLDADHAAAGASLDAEGGVADGATTPPGGPHAEQVALAAAGERARGATMYVTLEPCAHHGRTPPCTDAIVAAGIVRVVVGIADPDAQVAGRGIEQLRAAGIEVDVGVAAEPIAEQLAPYVKHRRTGRPWVVLKLAATLDGRTAAPDGTSRWLTGEAARADVHRLRAACDAILVGAGTVRADNPSLTVRLGADDAGADAELFAEPLRVVLGRAPADAKIQPAIELSGDLGGVLDELGHRGVLSVLVEGGATVARSFHAAGLVDRYVFYLAPAFFGGDDGRPVFAGPGAPTVADLWRGRLVSVERRGDDLRVELAPRE